MAVVVDTPYRKCYCEENVYKFIEAQLNAAEFYAVFISNDVKRVTLHCHSLLFGKRRSVMWDYHVIAVRKTREFVEVYDKDSVLSYPESFDSYWEETIRPNQPPPQGEERMFRIIHGPEYLRRFSSDRKHMNPISDPPPKWPRINPHLESNLMQWIDMKMEIEGTRALTEEDAYKYLTRDEEKERREFFTNILARIRRKIRRVENGENMDHWNDKSTLNLTDWMKKNEEKRRSESRSTETVHKNDNTERKPAIGCFDYPVTSSSSSSSTTTSLSSRANSQAPETENEDPVVVGVFKNSELIPNMSMTLITLKVEIKREPSSVKRRSGGRERNIARNNTQRPLKTKRKEKTKRGMKSRKRIKR